MRKLVEDQLRWRIDLDRELGHGAPPSGGRLGGGVHRVDEPTGAVPTASLEEHGGEREFPGRSSSPSSTASRRTYAAELPVSSESGRDDLFGRARLRAD